MAESIVQVSEGTGKKLHTNSYTVGANTVEDEVVIPGPNPYPTYVMSGQNISLATINDHIWTLNAGASLKVRVHRIWVKQVVVAAAVAVRAFSILRTTTAAPTGGTAVTPAPFETSDTAGAAGRTLPATKGTEAAVVLNPVVVMTQALATTTFQDIDEWEWKQSPFGKPLIIPAGATNGLAMKNLAAVAGATVTFEVEFSETAF